MVDDWTPHETSTHQDHVIAHTIGATILGYFVIEQALHILLDIGFVWTIYLDGEMGLIPQSVMIAELETDAETKARLREDIQLLETHGGGAVGLSHFTAAHVDCLITEVRFEARGQDERRILIAGEESGLEIETSLLTGEISAHVATETTAERDTA